MTMSFRYVAWTGLNAITHSVTQWKEYHQLRSHREWQWGPHHPANHWKVVILVLELRLTSVTNGTECWDMGSKWSASEVQIAGWSGISLTMSEGQGGFSVIHNWPILHLNLLLAWENLILTNENMTRNVSQWNYILFHFISIHWSLPSEFLPHCNCHHCRLRISMYISFLLGDTTWYAYHSLT